MKEWYKGSVFLGYRDEPQVGTHDSSKIGQDDIAYLVERKWKVYYIFALDLRPSKHYFTSFNGSRIK